MGARCARSHPISGVCFGVGRGPTIYSSTHCRYYFMRRHHDNTVRVINHLTVCVFNQNRNFVIRLIHSEICYSSRTYLDWAITWHLLFLLIPISLLKPILQTPFIWISCTSLLGYATRSHHLDNYQLTKIPTGLCHCLSLPLLFVRCIWYCAVIKVFSALRKFSSENTDFTLSHVARTNSIRCVLITSTYSSLFLPFTFGLSGQCSDWLARTETSDRNKGENYCRLCTCDDFSVLNWDTCRLALQLRP